MHSRLRQQVARWVELLERAKLKPGLAGRKPNKVTATGKPFVRPGP